MDVGQSAGGAEGPLVAGDGALGVEKAIPVGGKARTTDLQRGRQQRSR